MTKTNITNDRKKIAADFFRKEIIQICKNKTCWRAGKYLGSMLYFDIGDVLIVDTLTSKKIRKGEISFGVRDVFWSIFCNSSFFIDSDNVEDDHNELLNEIFIGQFLNGIDFSDDYVEFKFSGNCILYVDSKNRYKTEGNIVELSVHGQAIYELTCQNEFYISSYNLEQG